MKKRYNVSNIRLDRFRENMNSRERDDEIVQTLTEFKDSTIKDIDGIDLDNFSDYGISQIDKRIAEAIAEALGEASV